MSALTNSVFMKVPLLDPNNRSEMYLNLDNIVSLLLTKDSEDKEWCIVSVSSGGGVFKFPPEYFDRILLHCSKVTLEVPDSFHRAWESQKDGDDDEPEPVLA